MKAVKGRPKKVVPDAERKHICVACKESFQSDCLLKYHIRQHHFNCVGLAPFANTQSVNDVWVEKVKNTDALVEIKKVGTNEILIQKVKDNTVQPTDIQRDVIDVRKKYPVRTGAQVECLVCHKSFEKRGLGKHFGAEHPQLVKKRCEACDTAFKRVYNCATHVCPFASTNKKLKKDRNDEWTVIDSGPCLPGGSRDAWHPGAGP